MKVAIIAVSKQGAALAADLQPRLADSTVYGYSAYALPGQRPFEKLSGIIKEVWENYEGLVFFCAAGIVLRVIAPLIESKYTDPAVVLCPETGSFAVSLLSGHEGGANRLAHEVAEYIAAVPVISTGSEASPRITPRNLVLGIGCKRGTERQHIQRTVEAVFRKQVLSVLRIQRICTIDIKKNEPGLIGFAEEWGLPLYFFTSQELNALEGNFSASDFVREITGTDTVCERAALAGCTVTPRISDTSRGSLIVQKTALDGVALAVAERGTYE
ncbi:MAG: cobalamin biosynthesis protein [Treponema sp.]|jgi:cobalt-precorrin 5A hydrolase|nr:cobalamin biosynthesis protein [Treponema sp.]